MNNKLITICITLVVGVILAGSVLMPVLNDATTTHKTFTNSGYYDMTYTETDELTLAWDYTNPNVATINNESVSLPTTLPGSVNILCGDDWFLRWNASSLQFYSTASGSVNASVADSTSMSITASNGSMTVTNTASTPVTQTVAYSFMYVIDPDGKYLMKDKDAAVLVNGDSEIYAIGRSTTTGLAIKLKITGTIDDGFTAEQIGTSSATNIGDVTANYTAKSGYLDLYELTSLTVPITYGEGDSVYTAGYTYYIVPAEVTAELSQHLTSGEIALMGAIPVLVIVALLVVAVGVVARRND